MIASNTCRKAKLPLKIENEMKNFIRRVNDKDKEMLTLKEVKTLLYELPSSLRYIVFIYIDNIDSY
jgi:hypothetical protein